MLAVRDVEIELKNPTFDVYIEKPQEPCKTLPNMNQADDAFLSFKFEKKKYIYIYISICLYILCPGLPTPSIEGCMYRVDWR